MPRLHYAIPLLALGLSVIPLGQGQAVETAVSTTTAASTLDKGDVKFIGNVLSSGELEIKSSELAIKRGATGAVREFADKMITDHKMVDDELKTLAERKGVMVNPSLDDKTQKKYDSLSAESDKDFMKKYVKEQVSWHKDAVDAFEDASKDAKDSDVRAFAAKHLPHLQEHLDRAKALEKAID